MKFKFIAVKSSSDLWYREAVDLYLKKLGQFHDFEWIWIKSDNRERKNKDQKILDESKKILKKIEPSDQLILFDEKGIICRSLDFSKKLHQFFESKNHKTFIFLIGGAFGVDKKIKERAQITFSLGSLTFSHQVATVVGLEQLYRAFSIREGKNYHNETD